MQRLDTAYQREFADTYSGDAGMGYVEPLGTAALPDAGVVAGAYGSAGSVVTFTVDAKGLVRTATNTLISIAQSQVSNLTTDLGLKAPIANAAFTGTIGFQGSAAIAKPTVTGSRGSNAALTSLLTALATYGLITNSTTT